MQLLRELVPKCSRVALLWNPANPALFDFYQQVKAAAAVLGLTLQPAVEVGHVTAVNGPYRSIWAIASRKGASEIRMRPR